MLSPSQLLQEVLGDPGVLGPPMGPEIQEGPEEKTVCKAPLRPTLLPPLTAPHTPELTGGPGGPGPSPPATRPGSPCRTESAAESWVQFWAQEPCGGAGEAPGSAPAIPYGALGNQLLPFHSPALPLGLEVLALPEDKTGQRVMLDPRGVPGDPTSQPPTHRSPHPCSAETALGEQRTNHKLTGSPRGPGPPEEPCKGGRSQDITPPTL